MAFFDELRDKAKGLAQTGVAKSKQLGEIARLKASSVSQEDEIKKAYTALGKLYYAERGMAPEAAYAALCEKITAAKVNIEENKNRIEELKAESGINDLVEDVQGAGAAVKETVVEPLAEKVKTTVNGVKAKVDDAVTATEEAKKTVQEIKSDDEPKE